jgi:AAHS family 4-hydroxybenzoate transporter-like MFS transporter
VVVFATALFGILTMCFALADSYWSLFALRFIDGLPLGGMLPLAWALNIEYAPKRYRATIVTVIMMGYSLGTALGGPIAIWLIPKFGWKSVFVFGGAFSLLCAGILFAILPESIRFLASKGLRPDVIAGIVRRIAPGLVVPAGARFVVTDESAQGKDFKPSLLFAGELRWITTFLWIAYIFSSMTAFFLATWTPLVFEALSFTRSDAAWAGTISAVMGAVGGLLVMRFTDNRGAIAIAAMPLIAIPLLLIAGFVDVGHVWFFVLFGAIACFLIGGHFGLHSIAGIFYPSAYRGNGAGWATSVAKVGSIAGPTIAGLILSTDIPVRHIFAIMAICPAVFLGCILVVGTIHSRILRREERLAPLAPGMALGGQHGDD